MEKSSKRESDLQQLVAILAAFSSPEQLTRRVAELERGFAGATRGDFVARLKTERIDGQLLEAALNLKGIAARVNDIVHAFGILLSLPYVLETEEVVESLSLASGNTGRPYDLETNRQIAEFKFIRWRGGPESIRQNSLFVDLFNLAEAQTSKRRVIYVVGDTAPLRFLNNNRSLTSVLSKNAAAQRRFLELHGSRFRTVSQYYGKVRDRVEIIDLGVLVPELRGSCLIASCWYRGWDSNPHDLSAGGF